MARSSVWSLERNVRIQSFRSKVWNGMSDWKILSQHFVSDDENEKWNVMIQAFTATTLYEMCKKEFGEE